MKWLIMFSYEFPEAHFYVHKKKSQDLSKYFLFFAEILSHFYYNSAIEVFLKYTIGCESNILFIS